MAGQLSSKEKQLLQDQKTHEQLCIHKYQQGAQQASDPQLRQLFQSYAQQEQQHLNSINTMLNGQTPSLTQGQQSQTSPQASASQQSNAAGNKADAALCQDMLMTEKYVSGAYDTAIFEFADANMRQALNHIQKEEQQHGEGIYNYMNSHGMYNMQ